MATNPRIGLLLGLAFSACSGRSGDPGTGDDDDLPEGCRDEDGDGAGIGPDCTADDCDDQDPGTIAECGEGCAEHPDRLGCPCSTGQVQPCYRGPEGTGGQGGCRAGLVECRDGTWGACEGQVFPGEETCDGQDNDCDGAADDGVLSACGDCSLDCEETCVGVECDTPWDVGQGRAIVEDASGGITLGGQTGISNYVIWIANSEEGTVSKVNTRTREEEGRYRTGPSDYPDPSRSTVNPHGDVVSVNRTEGSASKILASDCTDQNGDGLHTSSGASDILDWGEDDCVVWHLDGMPGARGSAVEIRADIEGGLHEYVWVGSYDQGIIYEIDSESGEFTDRTIANVTPYGAALGPGGLLWTFGGGLGGITSIDTTTLERTDYALPAGEYWYGLTVDGEGRVWIGGSVARFDPASEEWETPGPQVTGGGIAVDANGNAWVGEYGAAWFVDGETMEATAIPGAGGHGWAIDFDGYAWSIVWGWDVGGGGNAIVVDPETLEVDEAVDGFVGPYTYSDMTGFQLVNATNPAGIYPHIFEACPGAERVHWSALTCELDAPTNTAVSFRVRIADSPEALSSARWVSIGATPPDECPFDLDAALTGSGLSPEEASRHLLELEVTLESGDREARPVVRSVGVQRSCEDIFG